MQSFVKEIVVPKNIAIDEKNSTNEYGKFIAEPYEKGYGHTIGNSFRRVLLSSIEGAAVIAVKIKGTTHEYAVLDGIKEDVMSIILNLKKLRFKMNNEERVTLRISEKGRKVVKASDIEPNAAVEIINKDLEIATLESGAKFEAELEVCKGTGYMTSEEIRKEISLPPDYIPMDALFSPVKKVYYTVENARVGQKTDYDKLVLEVWTDGTITPKEAVDKAANLLNFSLSPFVQEKKTANKEEKVSEQVSETSGDEEVRELLSQSVEMIELSSRAANCLKVANIQTIGELVAKNPQDLLSVKNFGQKSLEEIEKKLEEMGLSLGMKIEDINKN